MGDTLAVDGGRPLRGRPFPYRALFGDEELRLIASVFEAMRARRQDAGYQGEFEQLYTKEFCAQQGGGFADAVSSGTAAVFVALRALPIPAGSEILFSPVTDPGSISAALLQGHTIVLADAAAESFNVGPAEFEAALTPHTRAAVIAHIGGEPVDMKPIMAIARRRGVAVLEDCSQAHGARVAGKPVGCWGDIAAFSTMFSKQHSTGGVGGVVYTQREDYYWLARAHADRGRDFREKDFDPKNPAGMLFPALNFNLSELACAVGLATLRKLPQTIARRQAIAQHIDEGLQRTALVRPAGRRQVPSVQASPYFYTAKLSVPAEASWSKVDFARAVAAEGVPLNTDYRYVVADWPWVRPYVSTAGPNETPQARSFRDQTFTILFNERYTAADVEDIVQCILKVEKHFLTAGGVVDKGQRVAKQLTR